MTRPAQRSADSVAAEAAFRVRLAELGAILLEPEWLGSNKPHRVRCAAGHECSPHPSSVVRRGRGPCRECVGHGPAASEAAFQRRVAKLGGKLLGVYVNNKSPVLAICAAGHACRPIPGRVKAGKGICRTCAGLDPVAAEAAFRSRMDELGAAVLGLYVDNKTPILARCSAGHECRPRPSDVQRGQGICGICACNDTASAEAAFRARLAELGAELLEPYRSCQHPHAVRCAAGHECKPRPANVANGEGICRICANKIWDAFYVVAAPDADRLKFGITSGNGRPRLRRHRANGYREVIRLLTGLSGTIAPDIEQATMATLRLAGFRPVHGREFFDASALAVVLDVVDNYQEIGKAA